MSSGKKPRWILGVSAFYHDSAACLLRDAAIVAAAQEERFTRVRHDSAFPQHAISSVLDHAGIALQDLDAVAFYETPELKFERIMQMVLDTAPFGFAQFVRALPVWLKDKLWISRSIGNATGHRPILYQHHESHAASAFFPSPFGEAAVLTVDGVGEWTTTSLGFGQGSTLSLLQEIHYPHSLGLFYSAFTALAGFKVNSAEYKLMGLAPYGQPRYVQLLRDNVIAIRDDGSFTLNLDFFNFVTGLTMTTPRMHDLFGPPRRESDPISQRDKDIARSVQVVLEDALLAIARRLHALTGASRLCMAGGVALNCVANSRLLREGPFSEIWVQPAAGDAGGALGAAYLAAHRHFSLPRPTPSGDAMQAALLGPRFDDEDIERFLVSHGLPARRIQDDTPVCDLLVDGAVVGLFRGRMEFGPRALGCRSIVADPRVQSMQATVNRKIKLREAFRPFAPAVLREHTAAYYGTDRENPYMLFTENLQPGHDLPAVTHVDRSARLQTVDAATHPEFASLLQQFFTRTGCPVLLNTSFNVRGEPIVCTPREAYVCFMQTEMDALVLGSYLLTREGQPALPRAWSRQFEPD